MKIFRGPRHQIPSCLPSAAILQHALNNTASTHRHASRSLPRHPRKWHPRTSPAAQPHNNLHHPDPHPPNPPQNLDFRPQESQPTPPPWQSRHDDRRNVRHRRPNGSRTRSSGRAAGSAISGASVGSLPRRVYPGSATEDE